MPFISFATGMKLEEYRVNAPSANFPTFRLLDLPVEIRERVYSMTIPESACITIQSDRNDPKCIKSSTPNSFDGYNCSILRNLLLTCTTIHNEAKPILYGQFTFHFADTRMWENLEIFSSRLSNFTRGGVRKITFQHLGLPTSYNPLFAGSGPTGLNQENHLENFVARFPNLQTIRVAGNEHLGQEHVVVLDDLNKGKGHAKVILDIRYGDPRESYGRALLPGIEIRQSVLKLLREWDWTIDGWCNDEDQNVTFWYPKDVW